MQITNFPSGVPSGEDLILFQSLNDGSYRKASFGEFSGNTAKWEIINSNYTVKDFDKVFINATTSVTLTLPIVTKGEIELFNRNAILTYINLQGKNYNGANYNPSNLVLSGANKYLRLIYLDENNGWYPISTDKLESFGNYPTGMSLWIEGGSLADKSGNSRDATLLGTTAPSVVNGIDGKTVFRWSGAGNQELQVIPTFLSETTGATAYVVYTASNSNYNLLRTASLDDYWRFSNNSAGYFGTFRSSRYEAYPSGMPDSGHHLVSIHASSNTYEVILDNVSKGVQSSTYSAGDRFRIVTNDKPFSGDVALILIYPYLIDKASTAHASCLQAIKSYYPSLPFTL